MELILISNTKLKIMLNEDDMRQYHIGSESDCAEPDTRRAIRSLLERAREQIGFDTEGEEIFVQLYTSRRGGCELFVTKCPEKEDSDRLYGEINDRIPTEQTVNDKRVAKRSSGLPERREEPIRSPVTLTRDAPTAPRKIGKNGRIAFAFPDCDSLLKVCRALDRADIRPESRAFADERGNCYLLLLDTGLSAYTRLDRLTFILEYGRRENPDCLVSYVNEHGKVICDTRAIETLSQF